MPLLSIRIPASPDGKSNVYVELTKIPSSPFDRGAVRVHVRSDAASPFDRGAVRVHDTSPRVSSSPGRRGVGQQPQRSPSSSGQPRRGWLRPSISMFIRSARRTRVDGPLGSNNPRSVDFPRWLIGGATSGRVRHVPAGAPKAGYFAAFFLRSAQ